jgi:hypothetical protein
MNQQQFLAAVNEVSPEAADILKGYITGPDADITTMAPSHILGELFFWGATKEGTRFWSDVDKKLKANEDEDKLPYDEIDDEEMEQAALWVSWEALNKALNPNPPEEKAKPKPKKPKKPKVSEEVTEWNITITVDTNDADYIEKTSTVSSQTLKDIQPIIDGLKKFKPYRVKDEDINWTHENNFPEGECCRADLGEKTPEQLYPGIPKRVWSDFRDLLPSSEYGCHTIETIEIAPATAKKTLFQNSR